MWRTGVLAGDGGEDGVEVGLREGAAGEQRLQQGVVSPRQRRHASHSARQANFLERRRLGRVS
jgi:hypothetical protein